MNTLFFIAILVIVVLGIRSEAASSVESVEQEDEQENPVATIPHVVVPMWPPATRSSRDTTVQDLHREYNNIFKYGNRNAASHRWSTFLLARSSQMTLARLELFFRGFCAVSGSPIRPHDYNRYRLTLPHVPVPTLEAATTATSVTGYMHYCCWPCVCDTQDYIRIDTLTVTTLQDHTRSQSSSDDRSTTTATDDADGTEEDLEVEEVWVAEQKYFAVIGNPCDHPEQLITPFEQLSSSSLYGRKDTTTLAETAQEVRCLEDGTLEGATLSDHGYIIIGMFFDAELVQDVVDTTGSGGGEVPVATETPPQPGRISTASRKRRRGGPHDGVVVPTTDDDTRTILFQDEREFGPRCRERAEQGYNSGMGEIFRKVCAISPIVFPATVGGTPQPDPQPHSEERNASSCEAVLQ